MTKDFNRDLDQSGDEQSGASPNTGRDSAPDDDPDVARERKGEGFKGPKDAYAETGSRGAGYREDSGQKKQSEE
jgi:hypothetical protein